MDMSFPRRQKQVAPQPKTRADWLIHFRRAKCDETLRHMAERLWESLSTSPNRLDMWLAYGDRQDEIEQSRFVRRYS
ncbi:hypothetical protein [Aeromonas sp. Y311-2]|uniref:hypothetical protein n=1 Tax=Aeromonas sp. Y311-2 TaxID=2990507 RepID=UPI000D3B156E|nr:hypothetical protein [Aeromonas sp. Y311-2]